jgi:hypothetical protein
LIEENPPDKDTYINLSKSTLVRSDLTRDPILEVPENLDSKNCNQIKSFLPKKNLKNNFGKK